jgi:hypothetical protein
MHGISKVLHSIRLSASSCNPSNRSVILEEAMKNGDLTMNLRVDAVVFLEITYTPEASNRSIVDSQSTDPDASAFTSKERE